MELFLFDNDCKYAVEQIMLMLFPEERPVYPDAPSGGDMAQIRFFRGRARDTAVCRLYRGGAEYTGRASVDRSGYTDALAQKRLEQRIVKLSFYRAGILALGEKPVWGALSGIRPGKLMSRLIEQGKSDAAALREFVRLYDASPERARLCLDTAHASLSAAASLEEGDVCLYVGIPFCPTRCAYCSFVSQAVEKSMKLMDPFFDARVRDVEATGRVCRENGLRAVSVYFGGGTPTTLPEDKLDRLCAAVEKSFDLSGVREFTVEAGRPDTITAGKLRVLRAHGATRISVNPQTMSDAVLEAIGRRHTASDVVKALELVRGCGGFAVNMDLIAGLPRDTPEGFENTLRRVLELEPENVTVHTLSLKKGSRITVEGTELPTPRQVGEMLDTARRSLGAGGFSPYYLYRQKFMSGGFENVGWTRAGHGSLYNICIMEELCSILAMGGGASSKLVAPGGRIERVFAPKYPLEYIQGIDKVCGDKAKIGKFYSEMRSCSEEA